MRWRDPIVAASLGGGLLWAIQAFTPVPASAGTLYRWTTESGSLAFADDPRRIPERYRASAEEIQTDGLTGYDRLTPTDAAAQERHAERLADRLEGLREQSGVNDEQPGVIVLEEPPGEHPLEGIALQSVRETVGRRRVATAFGPRWRRTTRLQTVDQPVPVLGVTPDPDSDEPVIVERVRARGRDSLVTRHVTVVRQGDRVLSVIKPRSRHASSDFPIEEDLER